MNKRKLAVILGITIILAGIFFTSKVSNNKPSRSLTPSTIANNQETNAKKSTELTNHEQYISYSDDVIKNTSGKKVLFFHAQWCSQCRQIEADILKGPLPDGWSIIKVDYDSRQDLRKKYGVTLQTTFVKIDDNGNSLSKYVAYSEPTLDSVERNYLSKP